MAIRSLSTILIISAALSLITRCSNSDDHQLCGATSIILENSVCIVFEHEDLSASQKILIENKVSSAIEGINNLMPIDNLEIRFVKNQMLVIPEIGIGGYNPNQEEIIIAIDINSTNINTALEEDLVPILAHEIHHAKRRRSVGYGNTLLQAIISEGLADHFSIQLVGNSPPPWAVAISGSVLQDWIDTASNTWNESSYSHEAWFLGTDPNIPRWTGYAIGFELVNNYLLENPDKLPSTLFGEPASSFKP